MLLLHKHGWENVETLKSGDIDKTIVVIQKCTKCGKIREFRSIVKHTCVFTVRQCIPYFVEKTIPAYHKYIMQCKLCGKLEVKTTNEYKI